MQVKKEPGTEPLESDAKRMDGDANDKLSASVPEDVSLNTPVSNPEAGGDEHDDEATDANKDDENNENADAAAKNNSNKSETRTAEGEAADAELEDGGDLEGSVTAESPPDNTFDSDNDEQDEDGRGGGGAGGQSISDDTDKSETGFRTAADPVNGRHDTNDDAADAENSSFKQQQAAQSHAMKETSAEEDLLTSTEATSMEEGDEQYKNMIAETQMENIFN